MRTSRAFPKPALGRILGVLSVVAAGLVSTISLAAATTSIDASTSEPVTASAEITSPAAGSVIDLMGPEIKAPGPTTWPPYGTVATSDEKPKQASLKSAPAVRVEVKCWQHGTRILHETRLVPAIEPFPYIVKFPAQDAAGQPTYLADSRNATCLIRPAGGDGEAALRRR